MNCKKCKINMVKIPKVEDNQNTMYICPKCSKTLELVQTTVDEYFEELL